MLSPSVDIKSLNLHFEESKVVAREYTKGMGDAVADRTINRIKSDGTKEKWEDVARRVAIGNVTIPLVNLAPNNYSIEVQKKFIEEEFTIFNEHLRNGTLLMSGRHLQHGDAEQPYRNMEVFTNCSTSAFSFMLFFLLLNGSGVGRAYNDDMMIVDWANMPNVICCIDSYHSDVQSGEIRGISVSDAKHMYEVENGRVHVYVVPDSREGWAKAVEQIEWMTYQKRFKNDVLLIDFSQVRCKGSPIRGMQDRPASGPGPLITAIENVARVKHSKMDNWRKTLYIDHYLAECVLVGGARRAARMSTKSWRDENILDFIRIKEKGHLWTSNNSVAVDEEFWQLVREKVEFSKNPLCAKAHAVFDAVTEHAYFDGSGEPGLINVDKFVTKGDWKAYEKAFFADSHKYKLDPQSKVLGKQLVSIVSKLKYPMICNPCGEITINMLGAFCVIADVVPYHAESIAKAIEAFKVVVRSLMRVNLMDSIYNVEVKRTNRIGVSLTGLFEFAWRFFQFGFKDLIDEQYSLAFWKTLALFKREIDAECIRYAEYLGVEVPHTNTTLKPAGTTSKLFGLTEGAHLPSKREYLRWVQFRSDDPLIAEYRAAGYPVRELKTYQGSTIVGFPTRLEICSLGMGDKLIVASEATPEEQYQWLTLLEKYWINGVDEDGNDLTSNTGNQVSYTLKYDRNKVSYDEFRATLLNGQSKVRCCSVLPDTDDGENVYEYLPEESLDKASYELILNAINQAAQLDEDISKEHIDCSSGACPVDFNKEKVGEKKVDVLTPEGRVKIYKKEAKAAKAAKKSK